MKVYELTFREGEGRYRVECRPREPVNPLTAEQKYKLLLASIGCAAFIPALLVTGAIAIYGAAGAFLLFGLYKMIQNA